jgi:O-acetylhomoserine/O-acetylserine sulfhydrylase-like pyridoxal-dependent enzyme
MQMLEEGAAARTSASLGNAATSVTARNLAHIGNPR